MVQTCLVILASLFCFVSTQYLNLNLHRHQSCAWRKSSHWNRKIEFQGGHSDSGALLKSTEQKGCYAISVSSNRASQGGALSGYKNKKKRRWNNNNSNNRDSVQGKVKIHEDVSDELLIYLSVSTTGDTQRPPEVCRDANPETGCGGVGSCLYCRPCDSLDSLTKILGAQLVVNGKPAGCEPLKKGEYDNVELRFCLPKLAALLEWQGISEDALDHILAATTQEGNGPPKLSLFVTVYLFDKDIKPLLVSQRKLESRIRELRKLSNDEQVDSQTYWNLPFNQIIKKQSVFVGCHKLYGTISLSDIQAKRK
ncbi:hypothetical protein CAEBREN_10032 [Caenorhabditis brenneri]|uniref:Uncharacterized protein n=1 Tax=Caenorhabditis brenneri TaxID=135651 RepID=G0MX10_CAEBE|nr:hypothetical protein CAEBREN_10032 [Caenorhabditis brenneri]